MDLGGAQWGLKGCLQVSVVVVRVYILAKIHWEVHLLFVHFTVGCYTEHMF